MYNLKMATAKRRNMQLYLMQYIIYIPLPTNKVVLDKYTRSSLVNLRTQRRWQTSWLQKTTTRLHDSCTCV